MRNVSVGNRTKINSVRCQISMIDPTVTNGRLDVTNAMLADPLTVRFPLTFSSL